MRLGPAGAPVLDLARTHCLMTAEPTLDGLSPDARDTLARFAHGWADAYGPEASSIPLWAHAWAGTTMLTNLEPRFSDHPEETRRSPGLDPALDQLACRRNEMMWGNSLVADGLDGRHCTRD